MALDKSKIVEELSNATVIEIAELVKELETKWGVSAAAPVAAAAGPGAGAPAPAAEAKTQFDIILVSVPADKKIAVIKAVREVKAGLGLAEAKALVEGAADIKEYRVTGEFLKSPMPKEKTVFTYATSRPTFANVFHHSDYVRNQWGKYFEIIDIVEAAHEYQDVVLLRKR